MKVCHLNKKYLMIVSRLYLIFSVRLPIIINIAYEIKKLSVFVQTTDSSFGEFTAKNKQVSNKKKIAN